MATLGFQQGDRIVIKTKRNNPMNHAETYQAGEHGVIVEVPVNSSVVKVRLDGVNGSEGNYHVVESVMPLVRRPVRQRFVNASVLHLEKMKHMMRGDVFVFVAPDEQETVGRVIEVCEDTSVATVQPIVVEPGERYGPIERRPWAPAGDRCELPLDWAQCRVHVEEGGYLRDVSIAELRQRGLLRSQDEQPLALEAGP